jgi:hypothetical protein
MNYETANQYGLYILQNNQMKLVREIQVVKQYNFTQCTEKGKTDE